MPKVSIVIPTYKVEKYIERCARSLFEQTLDSIEYVFVDDCSPDNSIAVMQKVLEEYPQRKDQVKVIRHEVNQGVGAARNHGVAACTGDYIIHCDPDDWVDLNMYEAMYNKAIETNADMVCCAYIKEQDAGIYIKIVAPENFSNVDTYIKNNFCKHLNSLCSKLYKREIAQDQTLYTPDHICMGEDFLRNLQMLVKCQRIAYVENSRYHYRTNDESITHTLKKKEIDSLLEIIYFLKDNLPEKYCNLINTSYRSLLLTTLIAASKKTETEKICKDIWRQTPLSIKLGIISDNIFPWKSKLIVLAACINRKLISRILSIILCNK